MTATPNLPKAVVIGTRMSAADVRTCLDAEPVLYTPEFMALLREIITHRGYFNSTNAKKIKFYRIPGDDIEALTEKGAVLMRTLATGVAWQPDVAVLFLEYKAAEATVNAKYPYGAMDAITRKKYVADLSLELGAKLFKVQS